MNLYQIDQKIQDMLDGMVDPETGEIVGNYEDLQQLGLERDAKIENVALAIKNLSAESAAYKTEKETFEKREKYAKARVEWLKRYLSDALNGEKFQTERCSVTFRKTQSVVVDNPVGLIRWANETGNDDCVRYKDPEISKSAVKKLLDSGVASDFAHFETGYSVGVK